MFDYPFCFPLSAGFNPRTHTGCDTNELYGVNKFKSIKVRLKLTPSVHCQMCPKFQFHEGPIKAAMAQASVWGEPCFNSIKVRLKRGLYPCGLGL